MDFDGLRFCLEGGRVVIKNNTNNKLSDNDERLEYISELLVELEQMSRSAGCETLADLLIVAAGEAQRQKEQVAKGPFAT